MFGPILEYGCDHQITTNSRLSATMIIGTVTGVTLKIKYANTSKVYPLLSLLLLLFVFVALVVSEGR